MKLKEKAPNASYTFQCDALGTHFFACSVGRACVAGMQRVRVHVTNPDMGVTGTPSMADILVDDLIPIDYDTTGQVLTNARADSTIAKLESAIQRSPHACSDWIPPNYNSDVACKTALLSGIGYLERARPTPDMDAAAAAYTSALDLDPNHCSTNSYRSEMLIVLNKRHEAGVHFVRACSGCPSGSIEMINLLAAWESKGWGVPLSTPCSPRVTVELDASGTTGMSLMLATAVLALGVAAARP